MVIKDEQGDGNLGDIQKDHPKTSIENIGEQKARIARVWSAWEETKKVPELMSLVDRESKYTGQESPEALLERYNYPERTKISDLDFDQWEVTLNPKFIKDGYMYLLRGDHPNLENEGFYSRPYGYGKKTTRELTRDLKSSREVGYFLYGKDVYLESAKPSSENISDELAYTQSARGGSSFISTTTNLSCAMAGTGNNPNKEEQEQYEIYVIKVPVDYVINSNTGNHFGMEEDEYLIPDRILPNEIVAKFSRDEGELVYEYLHKELGIGREDLGEGGL